MNRKLIFVVCLIGSFIATGLYAETLDSMKRNLEKLKGEQTRLEEKIFTAEKELARIGSEQSKKMAEIKRYEDETAKARDVITKLKEIQPDYSKELSRRRAELKKDFEGPDGLIPEEKRTAYMEAFDQLPKNYTKQMWEKDAADLNSAKHAVYFRAKDIAALRIEIEKGRNMEDPLIQQITSLKKSLDRVNSTIKEKIKDIEEETACLAERKAGQEASTREKEFKAKIKRANISINNAMVDTMSLAIYKRLYGGFKAPRGGSDEQQTAGSLAESWRKMDNLKTLADGIKNPAGAAGMGAQAGTEVVGIMIQSLDIIKELYGLVGAMYNVDYAMGQARYGGALQSATSFDDAFDEIWGKMGAGKSLADTHTQKGVRDTADKHVQAMARGVKQPSVMVLMMDAHLAQAEKYAREADEMAKADRAAPGPDSPGGQPAVAKIEGYAIDQSDGSIGYWNSQYPNLSFDDEKGRRGKPNSEWDGSYYFEGNTLYLVIDNLRAKHPPLHTLGIGYTVTLQNATFEDGSTTKSLKLYQYSGTPKERRIVKGYTVITGSDRCKKK